MSIGPFKLMIEDNIYDTKSIRAVLVATMEYCLDVDYTLINIKFIENENFSRTSNGQQLYIYS